jgi:2-polyprenyl-3-methyl-5-hydroxy-6-metoxy-1,4-benzoquinol methylase
MPDRDSAECCPTTPDPRVTRQFDERYASWDDAEGFPEMVDVSTRLLEHLSDAGLSRPTVLEIGCGTGAVSVRLLELGARDVLGVDLSHASIDIARRRAAAAGVEDRATFQVGHGADVAGESRDWVVVDRVLCCDRHVDRMLSAVIGSARSRVAISVPESRGWRGLLNRPMWLAENVWDLLTGGCLGYVHDLRRIERRLAAAGFRPRVATHVGLWHVAVYERPAGDDVVTLAAD